MRVEREKDFATGAPQPQTSYAPTKKYPMEILRASQVQRLGPDITHIYVEYPRLWGESVAQYDLRIQQFIELLEVMTSASVPDVGWTRDQCVV